MIISRAIDTRRGSCGDDLLVAAEEAGDRLSAPEIVVTCNLLLIAGNLTTTELIGNGVLALLRQPDQLAKLCAQPGRTPHISPLVAARIIASARRSPGPRAQIAIAALFERWLDPPVCRPAQARAGLQWLGSALGCTPLDALRRCRLRGTRS